MRSQESLDILLLISGNLLKSIYDDQTAFVYTFKIIKNLIEGVFRS